MPGQTPDSPGDGEGEPAAAVGRESGLCPAARRSSRPEGLGREAFLTLLGFQVHLGGGSGDLSKLGIN